MIELFNIGFLTFTLVDLIDITIVAALFFALYQALKNTIAVQILIGLVILITLSFFTEAINLKSMNWILKTIAQIWLIAFIVLFQPELRRLMLMITNTSLFKMFLKSNISETLDEVVDAAIEMSDKHIGALIVFTRTQTVEMTVDSGIKLQSVISKELLISIFNTKAPLHDGAVVINNQIIMAARCVLPLSSVRKVGNRNLGTRHRAGLGLTEQIDALVLIVSEETGSISIAESGLLILDIPKNKLLDELSRRIAKNR